jgi:hypothetical protein
MNNPSDPYDPGHEPPPFDERDYFDDRDDRRSRLGVSDFVRKAIENTMGSVKDTSTVPREAITYLLQQGERGRRELLRIVAMEVGEFLRNTDLSREVIKILTGVEVELHANVKFKPSKNDPGHVEPDVDVDLHVGGDRPMDRESTPVARPSAQPPERPSSDRPSSEPRPSAAPPHESEHESGRKAASWAPGDFLRTERDPEEDED